MYDLVIGKTEGGVITLMMMLAEYRRYQHPTGGDTVGRGQTAGRHPGERRQGLAVGRHHHHPGHQATDEETGRQLRHDRERSVLSLVQTGLTFYVYRNRTHSLLCENRFRLEKTILLCTDPKL